MKKQYAALDILKLMLSFVVVAVHCEFVSEFFFPVARLAVPVFLILSGFFFFRKVEAVSANAEKNGILRSSLKRYLMLYGFWFVLLLPITIYARKYYRYSLIQGIVRLILDVLFGSTFLASWYLMACLLGIAAVYGLSHVLSNRTLGLLAVVAYALATAWSEFGGWIQAQPRLFAVSSAVTGYLGNPYQNVIIAIPYVFLGKLLAEGKIKKRSLLFYGVAFSVCLCGLMAERGIVRMTPYYILNCDCWFMLAPTALSLVLLVMDVPVQFSGAGLARNISTITYCTHYSIVLVIRKIIPVLRIPNPGNVTLFLLGTVASICVALVLLKLEKHRKFSWLRYAH